MKKIILTMTSKTMNTNFDRITVRICEWETITPDSEKGADLRGVELLSTDRRIIDQLKKKKIKINIIELKSGVSLSIGPYVGTINLSKLRIVIEPKIGFKKLMGMIAYVNQIKTIDSLTTYENSKENGLIDLLGFSLLRSVEHLVRGGLITNYEMHCDDLSSLRGRLDMRHIATHPRRSTLRCIYDDLTTDHALNQIVASGLRLASTKMCSDVLRMDLARAADRFFCDTTMVSFTPDLLYKARNSINRRTSHYEEVLKLITLIYEGMHLEDHKYIGSMPLMGFIVDMNKLFEDYLSRYLKEKVKEHPTIGLTVKTQDTSADIFNYSLATKPKKWEKPAIRPDFVLINRGEVIAIADAKYIDHDEKPPSAGELYQLATYGQAYKMTDPHVLLLYPTTKRRSSPPEIIYTPCPPAQHVKIQVVGVPIDGLIDGSEKDWWPFRS